MAEEEKKEEKIEVDKDFLTKVLEVVEDLKNEINLMKQGGITKEEGLPPVNSVSQKPDYIFRCSETISVDKPTSTPQDIIHYGKVSKEFREKLETLMKEYRVIQLMALFLKKL